MLCRLCTRWLNVRWWMIVEQSGEFRQVQTKSWRETRVLLNVTYCIMLTGLFSRILQVQPNFIFFTQTSRPDPPVIFAKKVQNLASIFDLSPLNRAFFEKDQDTWPASSLNSVKFGLRPLKFWTSVSRYLVPLKLTGKCAKLSITQRYRAFADCVEMWQSGASSEAAELWTSTSNQVQDGGQPVTNSTYLNRYFITQPPIVRFR